ELSIHCKLVLNVVGIEEIDALAILKSVVCVSRFDSSKFNLLKVVLCWEISLSKVFLIEVVATGSVAPSIFHLKRRLVSCHLYCSWDC
ncbi:hypothetical protein Goshw_030058, partial [Gossypium schwendimanii]|nr:hypothetical protein [Gossypium schwendimanii]